MANLDSEDKRRGGTGVQGLFIVPPVPDGTIDADDREQATYLYSGVGAASINYIVIPKGLLMGVIGHRKIYI